MNSGITCRAAPAEVLMRNWPETVSRRLPACSIAPRIVDSAGAMLSTNCAPAAVSETLRVVRWNSRTPMRASSAATAWLSAEVETPSSAAAARKLRVPRHGQHRLQFTEARGFHYPDSFIIHPGLYG